MISSPAEWERRLKTELESTLESPYIDLRPGLTVEDIFLEGSYPDTRIGFLFRDSRRPDCRFGYLWGTFWEWVIEGEDYVLRHGPETPESLATVVWTNFDEIRELHLPKDCEADGITWLE